MHGVVNTRQSFCSLVLKEAVSVMRQVEQHNASHVNYLKVGDYV